MDTTVQIYKQLEKIYFLLKKDLENKEVIYNYFLCERDYKFLNESNLRENLKKTKIENTSTLTSINQLCINIIELWNNTLHKYPLKKLKEPLNTDTFNGLLKTEYDFHAFIVEKYNLQSFNTSKGKEYFTKNYPYKKYALSLIASRCSTIHYLISTSYPETDIPFSPEYYLNRYLNSKSFRLQLFFKPFNKQDYDIVCKEFENYLFNYKYIYKNLTEKQKNEFRGDTIDHLKKILREQVSTKYVELTKNLISNISEFKGVLPHQQSEKSKPEPKETELSERIKNHFGFFNKNCPRKHKQILNDTDFNKLIEWAIFYFENDFKVPEILEPIKVVNTNKTFVQLAFKYLFKELHKSSPYPETLFEFYQRAFNPYSEDKKSNFEAVKNNDEVKKLMKIDY